MSSKLRHMSLDLSCIKYVGRRLYVKPFYGWGWGGMERLSTEHQKYEVPLPFHIKVFQFFSWKDDLWQDGVRRCAISGGIGIVNEPQHYLNEFWLVFRARGYKANFTNKLVEYSIELGLTDVELTGYGWMAETSEQIENHLENWPQPRLRSRPNSFVDHELRAELSKLLQELTHEEIQNVPQHLDLSFVSRSEFP